MRVAIQTPIGLQTTQVAIGSEEKSFDVWPLSGELRTPKSWTYRLDMTKPLRFKKTEKTIERDGEALPIFECTDEFSVSIGDKGMLAFTRPETD